MLVNGTARETPVGPPWITTSSGYFFAGSKSIGLWSTPSIVAPSWLFHETTSSVLVAQPAVCAFMSVSFFVADIHLGHRRRRRTRSDATVWPSRDSEKPAFTV